MRIGTVALQAILNGQGIDAEAKAIAKNLIDGFKEIEAKTTFDKVLGQLEGLSKTAKTAGSAFGDLNSTQLDKLIENLKRTQSEAKSTGQSLASILQNVQAINASASAINVPKVANADVMNLLGGRSNTGPGANLTSGSGTVGGGTNTNVMDLLGGGVKAAETWANLTKGSGVVSGGANVDVMGMLGAAGQPSRRQAIANEVDQLLKDQARLEYLQKTGQTPNRIAARQAVDDYLTNQRRLQIHEASLQPLRNGANAIFNSEIPTGSGGLLGSMIGGLTSPFKALSGALSVAGGIMIDKALFKVADGIAYVAKSAIESAFMFERAKISLGVLTGGKGAGNKMFEDILKLGVETPFTAKELLGQGKLLKSYGLGNYELTPTLARLGDVASGTGSDLSRISLAYGQVMSKGRFQGPELRQFTEAGVSVNDFVKAAKDMKYLGDSQWTTAKLLASMENGQIGSDLVKRALVIMTSSGGRFAGMNSAMQNTVSGQYSALKETGQIFAGRLGEAFFEQFGIKNFLKSMRQIFENIDMTKLSDWLGRAAEGLRPFGDAIASIGKEGSTLAERFFNLLPTWKEFGASLTNAATNVVPAVIDAIKLFGVSMVGLTKAALTVIDSTMKFLAPILGTAPTDGVPMWSKMDEGNPNRLQARRGKPTEGNALYKMLSRGVPNLNLQQDVLTAIEGSLMGIQAPKFGNGKLGLAGVDNIGNFAGLGGLAGAAMNLPAKPFEWQDYRKDSTWARWHASLRLGPEWDARLGPKDERLATRDARRDTIQAQNRERFGPEAERRLPDVLKFTTEQFDRLASRALPDFEQRLKGVTEAKKYEHEELQKTLTALSIGRMKGQLGLEGGLLPDQYKNGLLNAYESATKGLNRTEIQAAPALESNSTAAASALIQAYYQLENRRPKTEEEIRDNIAQLIAQGNQKKEDDQTIIRTLQTLSMQIQLGAGAGGRAR